MNNLKRALRYFRPDAGRMVFIFLLMLASIGLNVLKPWPLAVIVDSVFGNKPAPFLGRIAKDGHLLPALAVLILMLHLGQGALAAFQNFLSIKLSLRGLTRVRNEVFTKLEHLSLRFHQGSNSGDVIYRASWDTYSFQTLFQQGLVTFVTAFLSLLIMLVIMFRLNWRLTLVAVAMAPTVAVVIKFFGKKMGERTTVAQQADSKVTSLVQQAISAMPLIQSFTREDAEKTRFEQQVNAAQSSRVAQHGAELVYWFAIAAVFGMGAAAVTWLGANEVIAKRLTVGELLVFVAYLAQLYEPLNQLSHVGATMAGAVAGIRRVFEILDSPDEIRDARNARPIEKSSGRIEFQQVSFHYENGREVLHDLDFSIAPGESIALIGPSGAGKTTLLKLLPRFFDPTSGTLKLDGVDLRELRVKELRQQIAFVFQEPILLPGTIAENIGCGRTGATAAEIEAAARAANAEEFIRRLPKQYETVIGDGATRLSVGEQQRLNLARAFLKNAPVLLLDEPTSALDAENEEMILDSLQKLIRGRTTLIVAHRLRTIQQVDRVLVFQQGRLVESGGREELIQQGGYYSRLLQKM